MKERHQNNRGDNSLAMCHGLSPVEVLSLVGGVTFCYATIFSIPGVIAGWGLLARASWACIFSLVLSVFLFFNIPIGTAVGVYGLWVLMQDEALVEMEGAGNPAAIEQD